MQSRWEVWVIVAAADFLRKDKGDHHTPAPCQREAESTPPTLPAPNWAGSHSARTEGGQGD